MHADAAFSDAGHPAALRQGERLGREEFHRRYAAAPAGTWAELIEGAVHLDRVPGDLDSGRMRSDLAGWVGLYVAYTPGLVTGLNPTVLLDGRNEVQPAVLLLVPRDSGGATTLDADGYVVGPPEWVAEVRDDAACVDLGEKRVAYERAGVGECLVALVHSRREVRWVTRVAGRFEPIRPAADGLLKSRVFPGLWLDADALLAGDLPRLVAAVERGCATDEHAAFVKRLSEAASA